MVAGGVHSCRGCVVLRGWLRVAYVGYDEIRSMSSQYASYWNAFLFHKSLVQMFRTNDDKKFS